VAYGTSLRLAIQRFWFRDDNDAVDALAASTALLDAQLSLADPVIFFGCAANDAGSDARVAFGDRDVGELRRSAKLRGRSLAKARMTATRTTDRLKPHAGDLPESGYC